MKALSLLVPLEDHKALLRDLQRLGCVALETAEAEGFQALPSQAGDLRQTIREVQRALEILGRFVPRKKPLLSPRRDISAQDFWDEGLWNAGLDSARRIGQ